MRVCECGRVGIHCPQCGSASKNGLAKETIILTATFRDVKGLRAFRCRACPTQYIHCEWDGTEEDVLAYTENGQMKKGCFAPKKANISVLPQLDTSDGEAMMKAFKLIEAAGFKVVPKDAEVVEPKVPTETKSTEPSESISLDDLFKPKSTTENKDE